MAKGSGMWCGWCSWGRSMSTQWHAGWARWARAAGGRDALGRRPAAALNTHRHDEVQVVDLVIRLEHACLVIALQLERDLLFVR